MDDQTIIILKCEIEIGIEMGRGGGGDDESFACNCCTKCFLIIFIVLIIDGSVNLGRSDIKRVHYDKKASK